MKGTNRTHIILLTFLFSVLGGFLTRAWGETVTFDGQGNWSTKEKYEPDSAFVIEEDHVKFCLYKPMKQYNKYGLSGLSWVFKSHEYFYLSDKEVSELRWWPEEGYTIAVRSLSLRAKGNGSGNKGYLIANASDDMDHQVKLGEGTGEVTPTYNCSTKYAIHDRDFSDYLFGPDGTPFGNNGKFYLKATSGEYDFFTISLTYTITNQYTITLNNQSATTPGSGSIAVTYGSNTGLTGSPAMTTPTKTNCTFDGYYTGKGGTGTKIIDGNGNVIAQAGGDDTYTDASKNWKYVGDITLYAKWSGVPYSVHFNGNGNTGGGMSNQAFEYGTAQNLTANGFEKKWVVTFDANGGSCVPTSSEAVYDFEGWATSAGGDVEYTDEEEVENLTGIKDAVVDLYAKWASSPSEVELPMPTKANSVFTGWYNASEEFVGQAGDTYTPSGNETLKARWKAGASSANSASDISDGKIVMNGPHATFTFSGATNITEFGYTGVSSKPEGYKLAQAFDSGDGSKTYNFSWVSTNANCSIQVTKISFWVKAYNSNAANHNYAKVSFDGADEVSVGTAALTANTGDYAKFSKEAAFSNNVPVVCRVTTGNNFDYYIKNIVIEYTVTPNAPISAHDADLAATLSESAKQTLDVKVNSGSLFTMTSPAADFAYTYRLKEAYPNAHLEEDGSFWATATGDYVIQACVASGTDHEASEWSECTVHVVRTCVFENTEEDKNWSNKDNWLYEATPAVEGNDSVRVLGDLILDEEVKVRGLFIGDTANIEIAPVGGMTVGAGGISGATSDKLVLRASDAGKTGYLRVSPACTKAMPNATVELYSIAYANNATRTATWQYVGIPIASGVGGWDICTYGQQFIYGWSESTGEWSDAYPDVIAPFQGYCLTQNNNSSGLTFTFTGTLTAPESKEIPLSYEGTGGNKGYHVLANSYTAPIDITKMESTDFGGATGTIYLFNTGTYNESGYTVDAANSTTAGQYIAVTPGTAAGIYASDDTYPILIPAMQGFCVQTNTSTTLTLDYSKIVWEANYGSHPNQPMRVAAQRTAEEETKEPNVTDFIKVTLSDGEAGDNLYLLASEAYDKSYENGFDAPKMMSDDASLPNIFAVEDDEQLAIDATSDIEGTFLGVRTGQASNYTLYFSHVSGETEWMLLDVQTNEKTKITDEASYAFSAAPNSLITNRFLIVSAEENTGTTTGSDEITIENKIQKFIYNNHLLILRDGVLYDAQGRVVGR